MDRSPISFLALKMVLLSITMLLPNLIISQDSNLLLIPRNTKVEIPFELINGFLIVEATLSKDRKVNLLLDTGAENLILFNSSIKEELGYTSGKKISIKGADLLTEISAEIIRNVSLQLPNTLQVRRDFIVLNENFMNHNSLIGKQIDGMIGGRLFWGLVMEINYKRQKIVLSDKLAFSPPKDPLYQKIPIEIVNCKPYFTVHIAMDSGKEVPVKILVDSGSALPFLLFHTTQPEKLLPEHYIEGPIGRGLGGDIMGYIARLKLLRISKSLLFTNLITSYQGDIHHLDPEVYNNRSGLLGNPLLSRFRIIIDYVDHILYLKPLKNYNRQLEYDKSGLVIIASGLKLDRYIVKNIIKGSAAEAADIQVGDELHRIGCLPRQFCSLKDIYRKLAGAEGKKLTLVMKRKGVKFKKRITLRDFLKKR